jgi:cytochrome oxidase Cu insertion factor (SCO1/SenC/PrrC family)
MQGKRILGLAVMLCLWFVGSVGGVQGADTDPFEAAQLERLPRAVPLPAVNLPDLEGKQVALRSFQGQVVLMNFWTTW